MLRRTLIASALVTAITTPVTAAELVWQVEHPFRFLRFASDHRVHELAFEHARLGEAFQEQPVSAMEALLNDPEWWSKETDIGASNGNRRSPYDDIASLRERLEGPDTAIDRGRLPEVSGKDLQYGWAAMLRTRAGGQPADGTCWNHNRQWYQNCESPASGTRGDDRFGYVMPKRHFVQARIKGAIEGNCRFQLAMDDGSKLPGGALIFLGGNSETTSLEEDAPCSGHSVRMQLPYKPENRKHLSGYGYVLTAQTIDQDGVPDGRASLSADIRVSDYVIVAMGDSFASGEANPDMPALLDDTRVQRASFGYTLDNGKLSGYGPDTTKGFPRRKGSRRTVTNESSAKWIDRRCHRSMYGAPTRAAIALSFAGSRHHAITYLNFACSGAEVTDGLFWPQSGVECASSSLRETNRFMEPQLSGVVRELSFSRGRMSNFEEVRLAGEDRFREDLNSYNSLYSFREKRGYCEGWPGVRKAGRFRVPYLHTGRLQRKIDLLFLSISGNDIGFSPLIVSATLNNVKVFADSENAWLTKSAREAAGGISLAEARKRISQHLPARLTLLQRAFVEKLEMDTGTDHVLMTAYPSLARMTEHDYCGASDNLPRRNLGMSVSYYFNFNLSGDGEVDARDAENIVFQLNNKMKDFAKGTWTFVDGFKQRFIGHSICSQRTGKRYRLAENFLLPRKRDGASPDEWRTDDGLKLNPATDYRHYAKRQRWFRTFNDVYLGVHIYKTSAKEEWNRIRGYVIHALAGTFNARRATGGPFHPTAEGHAAVADALVIAAMKKLELEWPETASAE